MAISKGEAADALRTVSQTERYSGVLRGYAAAAPHFFVWGIVWAAGYGLSASQPDKRTIVWGVAIAAGAVLSTIIGMRNSGGGRKSVGRSMMIAGAIAAFFGFAITVLPQLQPRQVDALIPLVTAALYVFAGIWGGPRFGVAGLLLAVVTVAGYLVAGDAFGYWMAAAGGGLLVLTGLWLRSV